MLKNRYQEILVGMGLLSLVRGIVSLKRNRSTLLIDDHRFSTESYPVHFLSEMEILALKRLGTNYEVPELIDINRFLLPGCLEFVTEQRQLRLGHKPLINLKELLRKYPELIDAEDLDQLYKEGEDDFQRYFLEELARFERQAYETRHRPKLQRFELQGPKWFKNVYVRFADLLNQDYDKSKNLKFKGLLHLLGISGEDKVKTKLLPEEIPYYFFRILSPIYRLQDFFLTTQLKRRLVLLGGDHKESTVQFWQLHEGRFENLLLASFEGVISGDRVLFFSNLPEDVPFRLQSPFRLFRKAKVNHVKRNTVPFPPTALTFMVHTDSIGSDRPYRVMARGTDFDYYHWPYPELPGSKADFYLKDLLQNFEQDKSLLTTEIAQTEFSNCGSMSLDLRVPDSRQKHVAILERLPLEIGPGDSKIQGYEYWGPFRYQSFGLLSLCYGIEEV